MHGALNKSSHPILAIMEKSPESLAQEIASMREQLSRVSETIDAYESVATQNLAKKDIQSKGEISQKHVELFMETDRLVKKVRGPVDMVFSNFENVSLLVLAIQARHS